MAGQDWDFREMTAVTGEVCSVEILLERAAVALGQHRFVSARQLYRKALDMSGDSSSLGSACLGLAATFQMEGNVDAALAWYKVAIGIDPAGWMLWNNLGNLMSEICRPDEAVRMLGRALALAPPLERLRVESNQIMALQYSPGIAEEGLAAAARRFGERFAPAQRLEVALRPAGEPIRVGFVSPDMANHPVGLFLLAVLPYFDRAKVTLFCYFTGRYRDVITEQVRGAVVWREAADLEPCDLARQIRSDGIDVLVDLSGHTRGNRLSVFALGPAPVQMSWLGYFDTTGVPAMDHIVMDPWHVPAGQEGRFTEHVLRMPNARFCYQPPLFSPEISAAPFIKKNYISFGSFNNTAKLNPIVIESWSNILKSVSNSVLILKWKSFESAYFRNDVVEKFRVHGISADRLDLRPASPHDELLRQYADVDIGLDPFPFSGGRTSCEALWMGVPIITHPSRRPVSRQTLSLIGCLGRDDWLAQWVATSVGDYVAKAAALASDKEMLAAAHRCLRPAMRASPLMDPGQFARDFQNLLERAILERASPAPRDDTIPEIEKRPISVTGEKMSQIVIDGISYNVEELSDEAKHQINHIKFAEEEIQRLKFKIAIAQTARNTYISSLKNILEKNIK